jgi:hypothetical protein
MLRPILGLAAAGAISLLLWQLIGAILLPFLGLALGVLVTILKFVLIFSLVMFVIWLLRRNCRSTVQGG